MYIIRYFLILLIFISIALSGCENGADKSSKESQATTVSEVKGKAADKDMANASKKQTASETNSTELGQPQTGGDKMVSLPNGLQYEIITAGTGEIPGDNSVVSIHFNAYRLNGEQFDSSLMNPVAPEFMLNTAIDGLGEALKRMKVGATWKIIIPPNLGYGEKGSLDLPFGTVPLKKYERNMTNAKLLEMEKKQNKKREDLNLVFIKKNETVVYEVKLLSIKS